MKSVEWWNGFPKERLAEHCLHKVNALLVEIGGCGRVGSKSTPKTDSWLVDGLPGYSESIFEIDENGEDWKERTVKSRA